MKALFFGLGSIGRRHMRILRAYFPEVEIWHWNRTWGRAEQLVGGEEWFLSPLQPSPGDFAVISNPTEEHVRSAGLAAELGLDLFIEKQVSVTTQGLSELIGLTRAKNLAAYVAYPLRFHPFVKYMKDHLPAGGMHFECRSDASKWPSKRKLNHVVLELSHEIDLAVYLLGGVRRIRGECDAAGLRAEIISEHASGTVSSCLLDMASPDEARFIHVGGHEYPVQVDDFLYLSQWVHFLKAIKRKQAGVFARTRNELEQAARLFGKMEEFMVGA